MAFRRRFQTGTLGRSIRRFGRFPRPGFQRKQFAHLYSNATASVQVTADPELQAISLIAANDLTVPALATGGIAAVRNVSLDVVISMQVIPDVSASLVNFGNLYMHWGIFVQDQDEPLTTFTAAAATNSLIKWGIFPVYALSGNNSGAVQGNPTYTQMTRVKFRCSTLKKDEEVIFMCAWSESESKTGQLDACFVNVVQRVRYEIP